MSVYKYTYMHTYVCINDYVASRPRRATFSLHTCIKFSETILVASREREHTINSCVGIGIFHSGVHTHSTGIANECEQHWKKKEKQTTENIFLFFCRCSSVFFFMSYQSFLLQKFCVVGVFLIYSVVKKNY